MKDASSGVWDPVEMEAHHLMESWVHLKGDTPILAIEAQI
jgi:hypothetical protein